MRMPLPHYRLLLATVLVLWLSACGARAPEPFSLTIAHVNDTHSALEASDENLVINGQTCRARLGGFARLKTALDAVRAREKNVLFLHAGDAVQGTLYFNMFNGKPEFEFLNATGVDAMTLGNHEFDRGPALLGSLAQQARFPMVSANVDVSGEPALVGRIKPFALFRFGREQVAVIGATTPSTPLMTADVGGVRFLDPAASIAPIVRELKAKGVHRIVLLSHNGYEEDLQLARSVPGLDLIVGGHSHTLLGDRARLAALGLRPAGPYPTEVQGPEGNTVLVVQAWKWDEVLGAITLRFDAKGVLTGFNATPLLLSGEEFVCNGAPVRADSAQAQAIRQAFLTSGLASTVPEDPAMLRRLEPYARQLVQLQNAQLGAKARVDLIRGSATDPGPIVADAYLKSAPSAQIAFVNAGGLRRDLFAGELTMGMVLGVLPFGNTLVTLDLTGAEVKKALEEAVEFRITLRPPDNRDLRKISVIHTAGLTYVIRPDKAEGERIFDLRVRQADGGFAPLNPAGTYRVVTSSFLAGGGDGLDTLKAAKVRTDTGILEHDSLAAYLTAIKDVAAPAQPRVVIDLGNGLKGRGLRGGLEERLRQAWGRGQELAQDWAWGWQGIRLVLQEA